MAKSSSRIGVFIAGILVAVLVLVLLMVVGVLPVKTEQVTTQTTSTAGAAGGLTPQQIYEQEGAGVVEVHASFAAADSGSPSTPSSPAGLLNTTTTASAIWPLLVMTWSLVRM